jgi:hypothetical protein
LPTCNTEELGIVFGPVNRYIMEDGDSPILLRFGLKDEKLRTEKIPLEQ